MALSSNFSANVGFNFVNTALGFMAQQARAKNLKAWQNYNNKMVRISGAVSQNAITLQQNMAKEAKLDQDYIIGLNENKAVGTAENNASASGTDGRSVRRQIFDVNMSAAMARQKNEDQFTKLIASTDQQRQNIAVSVALKQDNTPIQSPNIMQALLGFGQKTLEDYKKEIM